MFFPPSMENKKLLTPSYMDFTGQTTPEAEPLAMINPLPISEWVEIPVIEGHAESMTNFSELSIPIKQGRDIKISLKYDGSIMLQDKARSAEGYHETNPFFNSLSITKVKPIYEFKTTYKPPRNSIPEKTVLGASKYSKTIKNAYDFLKQEDRKIFRNLFKEFSEEKNLENIMNYLSNTIKKIEETPWEEGKALDKIISKYKTAKITLGSEEGLLTFIAAAFTALNIPARKVSGQTTMMMSQEEYNHHTEHLKKDLENKIAIQGLPKEIKVILEKQLQKLSNNNYKEKNGLIKEESKDHRWNEVFIPVNKMQGYWALFDFKQGLFGPYPSEKPEYSIDTQLPLMKSPGKAELKIEYI